MAIRNYKTKKGEIRYQATIWSDNRAIKSKSFKRKFDAQDWERRQQTQMQDNNVGRLKGEKKILSEFFEQVYWINKKIRDGTAMDYRRIFDNNISPEFGHRPMLDIMVDEWATFFSKAVLKGMSKSRANRVHAVASAIYKMAVKFRYAQINPLHQVDWFEEDLSDFDYWTFDEADLFLNWAFRTKNPRFVLYQTAYETGMRISEIQALQRDCVDLERGLITVRRAYCKGTKKIVETTKGAKKRRLGINPSLISMLQKHLGSHNSQFVFCGDDGELLNYGYLYHQFEKDQIESTVRCIGIHDVRHTYASHYVMKGGNIYDLKELLGHSGIETTMRYAHLAPGHLKSKSALVSFSPKVSGNVVELKAPKYSPNIEASEVQEIMCSETSTGKQPAKKTEVI